MIKKKITSSYVIHFFKIAPLSASFREGSGPLPDGDGVAVAGQQLLHVQEACDLLQDVAHVRVQVVHRAHLVADADGWGQGVGQSVDQLSAVEVIRELERREGSKVIGTGPLYILC